MYLLTFIMAKTAKYFNSETSLKRTTFNSAKNGINQHFWKCNLH